MPIIKEGKHVFPLHLKSATLALFISQYQEVSFPSYFMHTPLYMLQHNISSFECTLYWTAGLVFANRSFKSAIGICNRDSARVFFWPSRFVHSWFFFKQKWLICRFFCCLFKETYSEKERKMYFVKGLKSRVQFDFQIRRGKARVDCVCGCHPKYMPVSYTNMAAIHVGWQHKYIVAKVCFRLSRTCFDPGKKTQHNSYGMTKPHRPTQDLWIEPVNRDEVKQTDSDYISHKETSLVGMEQDSWLKLQRLVEWVHNRL